MTIIWVHLKRKKMSNNNLLTFIKKIKVSSFSTIKCTENKYFNDHLKKIIFRPAIIHIQNTFIMVITKSYPLFNVAVQ